MSQYGLARVRSDEYDHLVPWNSAEPSLSNLRPGYVLNCIWCRPLPAAIGPRWSRTPADQSRFESIMVED